MAKKSSKVKAKKRKKGVRGRKRSTARRASTAKRGKVVALSMKQLSAMMKKAAGGKRRKGKRGGKRSGYSSDPFEYAFVHEEKEAKLPAGLRRRFLEGASSEEKALLSEIARAEREIDRLSAAKRKEEEALRKAAKLQERAAADQAELEAVREARSEVIADREARFQLAIEKHKARVDEALEALRSGGRTKAELRRAGFTAPSFKFGG